MSKTNKPNSSQRVGNQNYFAPLQTIDNDDSDDDIVVEQVSKEKIPPLTILKCTTEQIHEMMRLLKITEYSIRKISIGLKVFFSVKNDYDRFCNALNENYEYEFFTYATKNEKPFKAVLLGLDKCDPIIIKNYLISKGLKCTDVKIVIRDKENRGEMAIFIVYFERKTISLKELRENYSSINYIRVRWEYQKPKRSKITQCYNCQMFGHGSSRCKVKTYCANCAGSHKTIDCKSSIVKCANCKGPHKSMSPDCPSRSTYLEVKQRTQPKKIARPVIKHFNNSTQYSTHFPNSLNQQTATQINNWGNVQSPNQNNDLSSLEELKTLTVELITNLSKCKSRADQFDVITNLAFKFLAR